MDDRFGFHILVNIAGPGDLSVFGRSTVVAVLKYTVKGGKRVITASHCYIRHGITRIYQKQLCIGHAAFLKVFVIGDTGEILKKTDKVRL